MGLSDSIFVLCKIRAPIKNRIRLRVICMRSDLKSPSPFIVVKNSATLNMRLPSPMIENRTPKILFRLIVWIFRHGCPLWS